MKFLKQNGESKYLKQSKLYEKNKVFTFWQKSSLFLHFSSNITFKFSPFPL